MLATFFRYVGDFLNFIKSVTNILNQSPTHLVSKIRHQHRRNRVEHYFYNFFENLTQTPPEDILNTTFPAVTVMPVFIPIPVPIPFPLAKSYPIKRKSEELETTQTKTLPLDLTVKKM